MKVKLCIVTVSITFYCLTLIQTKPKQRGVARLEAVVKESAQFFPTSLIINEECG